MSDLKQGDIIQATDPDDKLYMCLLIVDEVKSWGVQAYAPAPSGDYYYRIESGKFEKAGTALMANKSWKEGEDERD